jgi:hypothetical protein
MASGNYSRFRYALRLVASVFLLSSPCQGAWATSSQAEPAVARNLPDAPATATGIFAGASHPVR